MNAGACQLARSASAVLGLIGGRSAPGLLIPPATTVTGMGFSTLSVALALGQLAIGLARPLIARISRPGAVQVLVISALLLTLAMAMPVFWPVAASLLIVLAAPAFAGPGRSGSARLAGDSAHPDTAVLLQP